MNGMTNEEIIKEIQSGTDNKTALMEQLYKQNEGMIRKMANKAACGSDLFDDLTQEGYFALESAVSSFDLSAGVQFITYFATVLKWHYVGVQQRSRSPLSMPRWIWGQLHQYSKWKTEYMNTHEAPPRPELCCYEMGWKREKLDAIEMLLYQTQTVSIDTLLSDTDDLTVGDMIADENNVEESYCEIEEQKYKNNVLHTAREKNLTEKEQAVLLWFYTGKSYALIAEQMKLPSDEAKTMCRRALRLLRADFSLRKLYYESNAAYKYSVQRFKNTGISSVEFIAEKHMDKGA